MYDPEPDETGSGQHVTSKPQEVAIMIGSGVKRWAIPAIAGVLILSTGPVSAQDEGMNATQARMRGVFLTLTKAYKYSLDPAAFEDLGNRDEIRA